ncbi:MAG TPA: PLP-dependent aminotransferase family protein [Allosphingosinicella sp.]|nr:PLP-dependent aminotransferase family protein [Allosphingosinicella sp.]
MRSLFELRLDPVGGPRRSTRSLYEQLKAAIIDGRLAAGVRLPGTRQSSQFFGVSRNTATEIYERLANDGYVVSRHGSGTFVAEALPPAPRTRRALSPDVSDPRLNPFWLSDDTIAAIGFWRDPPTGGKRVGKGLSADFRPALLDSRLFPLDLFRQVSVKQLRQVETRPPAFKSPQGNQGNFHLREAIVRHIALTRAVPCLPDDVLVTSGAQQAFDLVARTLVKPGETIVAIEDPGYPPMRVAFAAAGARIVPVGVDAHGLMVERLPADANIVCVCPSHQFPTGVTMSAERRAALIAFARARGAVIVEDDYDGEFRYEGSPLEALRTAEAADLVFYVGTFSKCMLPSLRLGFVAAPPWAMPTLVAAKNCLDWHCPIPVQLGVSSFISEGHLTRHVRRMRGLYDQRRRRVTAFIGDRLSDWLEAVPTVYGMHVAAFARRPLDCESIAAELGAGNVKLHALDRYYLGPRARQGFVFGYGAVNLDEIDYGLAALHKMLMRKG